MKMLPNEITKICRAHLPEDVKKYYAADHLISELCDSHDNLMKALYFAYKHIESMDNYSLIHGARHVIDEAMKGKEINYVDKNS